MKIYTITCHDVYNAGAGLQAYALNTYLKNQGHDAEIIDYKPDYLSNHYGLWSISSKYDRPFVKIAYLLAKFPGRFFKRFELKKKKFDSFKKDYLQVTKDRYLSCQELNERLPKADVYIAGSDQIWNPLFPNGKDPSFFLQFAQKNAVKASYAASFAVDSLSSDIETIDKKFISELDYISVREQTGLSIIEGMGITKARTVLDPVFLIDRDVWIKNFISKQLVNSKYLLVYDFDKSSDMKKIAQKIAKEKNLKIITVFKNDYGKFIKGIGPIEFLNLIYYSDMVISNSFHATAFSIIFEKQFFVCKRKENLNSRMSDLLSNFGFIDRLIDDYKLQQDVIDYQQHLYNIKKLSIYSHEYIKTILN
ncbi:MAG: polysaccharide pyruvyl transferase family protein [Bacillota bacterium]